MWAGVVTRRLPGSSALFVLWILAVSLNSTGSVDGLENIFYDANSYPGCFVDDGRSSRNRLARSRVRRGCTRWGGRAHKGEP